MVTNRTGLGVHDVVVRYQVSTQQPGYTTPAKRPLFSWAAPKRPAAEPGDGRTVTAVDGVSLEVAPGEVVALLGASGSGKSSLLRAIAGLEPLASGRITWDGEDLSGTPTHKRNFGMMFQDPALFPSLNVGKNVAYGLHKLPRTRRAQTVEKFLDPRLPLGAVKVVEGVADVAGHAAVREQLPVLEHHHEAALVDGHGCDVLAVPCDPAAGQRLQPGDRPQQRRLA